MFKKSVKRGLAGCSLLLGLAASLPAQVVDNAGSPADVLRRPGGHYGIQVSAGSTVLQVSAPVFVTAGQTITNLAVAFQLGRVLTHEHGSGWKRGTFEWDIGVIPAQIFWVLGSHYTGGFELAVPRWNFTRVSDRAVPFVGLSGGLLFSPNNFPPGDTAKINFTAALDAGVHVFPGRRRHSFDVAVSAEHISNAYTGRLNPGVPLSLQVTVGHAWFGRQNHH